MFTCSEVDSGQIIGYVTASDPDDDVLTFSATDNSNFIIDPVTGVIVVSSTSFGSDIVVLNVTVSDGELDFSKDVTINLTSPTCAPGIMHGQIFPVFENPVFPTFVGTVEVVEGFKIEDDNVITYSILSSVPAVAETYFVINSTTGIITTTEMGNFNLDYEDFVNSYPNKATIEITIGIEYTDLIGNGVITITISDVNEAPVISSMDFNVLENVSSGVSVGILVSEDRLKQ